MKGKWGQKYAECRLSRKGNAYPFLTSSDDSVYLSNSQEKIKKAVCSSSDLKQKEKRVEIRAKCLKQRYLREIIEEVYAHL